MKSQWTITADHIADLSQPAPCNMNAHGMVGPRRATLSSGDIANHPHALQFRMFDDDGELYYEGFCIDTGYDDGLWRPLDDFGSPNAGCTKIMYLIGGTWTEL